VVVRLLILKHIRNWSYEKLEREVRANLVHRDFTHVGGAKMPDAKTMGRWGLALGPEVLRQVYERIVKIACDKGVTAGRRMRVDTRWSRPTSTIRPTAPCWEMAFEC
jgi:transposase, IS5 family